MPVYMLFMAGEISLVNIRGDGGTVRIEPIGVIVLL